MSQQNSSSNRRERRHIRWADQSTLSADELAKLDSSDASSSTSSRRASRGSASATSRPPVEDHTWNFGPGEAELGNAPASGATEPKNEDPQAQRGIKVNKPTPDDLSDIDWHILSPHEVAKKLCTSTTHGLFEDQAKRRLRVFGENAEFLPKVNAICAFRRYFFNSFGILLLLSSVLVFVTWEPLGRPPDPATLALAIFLLMTFFFHGFLAMNQDWSSSVMVSSLKSRLHLCEVKRSGQTKQVFVKTLVPGDFVTVRAGDRMPADLRLISVSPNAKLDRSALTGEVAPFAASIRTTDTSHFETRNLGLQGTYCLVGSCTGLVVATGKRTVFGRIAALSDPSKTRRTPIEKAFHKLFRAILLIMGPPITCLLVTWAIWKRKDDSYWIWLPSLILDCAGVAVASIPQGIPIAMTIALIIVAEHLRKQSLLCKSYKSAETLGSVSLFCSDKTGTLTEAKMAVVSCCFGARPVTVKEAQQRRIPEMAKAIVYNVTSVVGQLGAICALCNAAEIDPASVARGAPSELNILGDATDTAILRFSEELGSGNVSHFRAHWRMVYELAFDSRNKYMIRCFSSSRPGALKQTMPKEATENFGPNDILLTIKGAPEILIGRCSHFLGDDGAVTPLDAHAIAAFEAATDKYSSRGLRCIMLAQKTVFQKSLEDKLGTFETEKVLLREAESGLLLTGLVAIADPLRPEVKDVLSLLRAAGIKTCMITGDSPLTALAVAREAGIVTSTHVHNIETLNTALDNPRRRRRKSTRIHTNKRETIVISGHDLTYLYTDHWTLLVQYREIVFARMSPQEKLFVVRMLQTLGPMAMVGDGVNDVAALTAADIGIAVRNGCDLALEAADMILMDDFSSIIPAIQYGRLAFDNLKKITGFLLPAGSFAQVLPVVISFCFGFPLILPSFLMIVICCITDCVAAIPLIFEKPESGVLLRPPRDTQRDRLVSRGVLFHGYLFTGAVQASTSFAMAFWYFGRKGITLDKLWLNYGDPPADVDEDYYLTHLSTASSIYFLTLIIMQWFNILSARTQRLGLFQHPPLLDERAQNRRYFSVILFSLVVAVLVLYLPPLQHAIQTSGVPVEHWVLPLTFGIVMVCVDEVRKYSSRRWPKSWVASLDW